MIRIESITIHEFRGIRDLTFHLNGKNFAVCGHNGTGKSGVVDALEFALTGNISRLTGKGTGGITVKEHAPHVDSRNCPDKARVILRATIPRLSKNVTIERTVKDAGTPIITPDDPEIRAILDEAAAHSEIVLSRRELIRYVLSAPGDRAKDIQVLLRLEKVENLRTIFQKIGNDCKREIDPLQREKTTTAEHLLRALEIPQLKPDKVLEAVNIRRAVLGLPVIEILTPTTSLREGLVTVSAAAHATHLPKAQAAADIAKLKELLVRATDANTVAVRDAAMEHVTALSVDPTVADGVTRERFLQSALELIDAEACPVCDTAWNPDDLREHIRRKLRHYDEIAAQRAVTEKKLEPLIALLIELQNAITIVERYSTLGKLGGARHFSAFRASVEAQRQQLTTFLPLSDSIRVLENFAPVSAGALDAITELEAAVAAIPEPSQQDAARDYLTVCHERLEAHRGVSLRLKLAEDRAAMARKVFDVYAKVSTEVLEGIYKEVQKDFSALYRFLNREDEDNFEAHLVPSIGKLGFDVDFYGRGFFPPGAYHSEGHQDSMGLCLYLALMKHLLGDSFTIAVLDDVLMSVDAGHRREVCTLLKTEFPNTQFVLTTHDPIWLRHMKTAGLIAPEACVQFRTWDVDRGPTEWDQRDLWQEIEDKLKRNDVRDAAALLRHFLEYTAAEVCHRLRARVEFRGDAQFQLGDLLPSAVAQFGKLLEEGVKAARSWGKTEEADALAARRAVFRSLVTESNVEQWQINKAVHYNEWTNLCREDFAPVVNAQRRLIEALFCGTCLAFFYVVPEHGNRDVLKCACGEVNVNFARK